MSVLLVTLAVSLALTVIFVCAFLAAHLSRWNSGPEHDSLLPLDDTPPSPPISSKSES